MGVPGDLERYRQLGVAAAGAHRDPGQVERLEDQLHLLPGQMRLDRQRSSLKPRRSTTADRGGDQVLAGDLRTPRPGMGAGRSCWSSS
jgi:hypothetical protein